MRRALDPAGFSRMLVLAGIFMAPACGGVEHEYEKPPEVFDETKQAGESIPVEGEVAPEPSSGRSLSEVIVDCERHIRAWEFAQSQARSVREREQVQALRDAVALYVAREMDTVREAALIGESRARGVASTALGFSGDPGALPILLNNLGDPNGDIVANAMFGLGMLASPDTPAASLEEVIRRPDVSLETVQNAAFAATAIAQARSKTERGQREDGLDEVLIMLIDRPESGIRAQAAGGLGYAKSLTSLPLLYNLLAGDPEPAVRYASAFAMGEIGASESGGALVDALDDPEDLVRAAARGALAKIYGRDYGPDPAAWEPALLSRDQ